MVEEKTEKNYIRVAAGQIHYRHRAGSGTALVCLHQTASSSAMFARLMEVYAGPHPIYALDTPGFGGSYDPPGQPSMAAYADTLVEALSALGIGRAHLFGHHTGASLAVEIAARYPQLAASLIMIGPVVINADEAQLFKQVYPKDFSPRADGSHLKLMWDYVGEIGGSGSLALQQREFVDTARAWQGHIKVYSEIWDQDFCALYQQVRCPLMIMCSPDDVLWTLFERAKSMRPDARAVELGGTNFQPDEVPEDIAAAVAEFVADL